MLDDSVKNALTRPIKFDLIPPRRILFTTRSPWSGKDGSKGIHVVTVEMVLDKMEDSGPHYTTERTVSDVGGPESPWRRTPTTSMGVAWFAIVDHCRKGIIQVLDPDGPRPVPKDPVYLTDEEYTMRMDALTRKDGPYVVVLASRGNADFRQDPNRSLPGVRKKRVRVFELSKASMVCRLYIERHELGGGNWCGGEVIDHRTKVTVAQVSYNGRVWKPGPYPQPEIEVGL